MLKRVLKLFKKIEFNVKLTAVTLKKVALYNIPAVILIVFIMNISISVVPSESMDPTLKVGDVIFMNRNNYELDRGDIVYAKVIFAGENKETKLVKRLIGLPGDTIEVIDRTLYRNSEIVVEDYDVNMSDLAYDFDKVTVPNNGFFLMGDNRLFSYDSRDFGSVTKDSIVGELLFSIPLSKITSR